MTKRFRITGGRLVGRTPVPQATVRPAVMARACSNTTCTNCTMDTKQFGKKCKKCNVGKMTVIKTDGCGGGSTVVSPLATSQSDDDVTPGPYSLSYEIHGGAD